MERAASESPLLVPSPPSRWHVNDSLQASTWNWTVPFLFHQSFQNRNEKSKTISNTEPWALHRRPPSFWTAQGVGASSRSTSKDSDAKSQIRTALHQNRENRPEQLLSQMFKEVRAKRPVNIPEADQIDRWKNTQALDFPIKSLRPYWINGAPSSTLAYVKSRTRRPISWIGVRGNSVNKDTASQF